MTIILLEGLDLDFTRPVAWLLQKEGHFVIYHWEVDTLKHYQETMPDIMVVSIYGYDDITEMIDQVLNFDSTACIFVLVPEISVELEDRLYKAGARAILPHLGIDQAPEFVFHLINSCSDIKSDHCSCCWKVGRFENQMTKQLI